MGTSQKARVFKQLRSVGWSSKILMDHGGYSARLFPVGILRSAEIPDYLLRWDIPAWSMEMGNPDGFKRPDSRISDAQSEDIRKYVATLIYNKTSKKNNFRHLLWRATSYSDRISARLFHIFWAPFLGCPQLQRTKKNTSSLARAIVRTQESYRSIILKPQGFTLA